MPLPVFVRLNKNHVEVKLLVCLGAFFKLFVSRFVSPLILVEHWVVIKLEVPIKNHAHRIFKIVKANLHGHAQPLVEVVIRESLAVWSNIFW